MAFVVFITFEVMDLYLQSVNFKANKITENLKDRT